MKEIRRTTRVIGAFPDGARLRHIAGTMWSTYMNMRPLFQKQKFKSLA